MGLAENGISLASPFKYQAGKPLDVRATVENTTERDALVTSHAAWEGMRVFVRSNKKSYYYINGSWTEAPVGAMYTHPSSHPATMITEDTNHRFMTDAERTKLSGIATGANKYVHPGTHALSMITETDTLKIMTADERTKLAGIATGANKYTHPSTHAASMIVEDATHRFFTDTERTKLEGIAENANNYSHPTSHALSMITETTDLKIMTAAERTKLAGIATNANNYSHPTSSGNKHIPSGGSAGQILRWSADGTAVWGNDNNTTYNVFGKATADAAGSNGLVPAPAKGDQLKFLRADGTWVVPTNTTYGLATSSANGLLSSGDFTKLSKFTATEAGYLSGVTSSIQTQLNGKAASSHGTHVSYSSDAPKANGTAAAGSSGAVARADHVHPLQTNISGNAATATKATQDSAGQQIDTTYIKGLSVSGRTITYTKGDGTTGTITTQDTNTTYSVFGKATANAAGSTGLVPAPAKGDQLKFLRADGTWVVPTNTTYGLATSSSNGLMSSSDFSKLAGIAANANNYSHPTSSGNKHIPSGGSAGQILRWSADGTAVWGNDNNTTYSVFGAASADAAGSNGLVPAPAKGGQNLFLKADGTWATPTNTTYSLATSSALGLVKLYTGTGTGTDGTMTQKAITDALGGKSSTSHTHNYAGSSSAGGAANSVANSVIIKLNGGSTEGTNLFTFNGSAAKTINITPSAIGAAASSHGTHVSYSTDAPKANGTAAAGSSGAVARADHVHPLQTTISGNAATATKATQDSAGQQINTTYIKGLSVSGKVITYTKGDGTTGTITTQDTNTTYSTGTASASGLTKLYTGTGTGTDGTMTQKAITSALGGKSGKSSKSSVTLSASSWSGDAAPYTITVSVSGVTTSNNVEVLIPGSATDAQVEAWMSAAIVNGTQASGSITLKAYGEKPSIDIPIECIVRADI